MPKLFKFLLKHIAVGILVGWAFVAALLWFDVAGFGSLVLNSASRNVALALLGVSFAVTFGSASAATAVLMGDEFMTGGDNGDQPPSVAVEDMELVPVKAGK